MTPATIAFFDVDETLISIKSMFSFQRFYLQRKLGKAQGERAHQSATRRMRQWQADGVDRTTINRRFYEVFNGHRPGPLRETAHVWYHQLATAPGFFIDAALTALRQHQEAGHSVAFVSGSAMDFLQPLADDLGVSYLLANQMEVKDDRYTGQLIEPQTIGAGKREVVSRLLTELRIDPAACHGYGDHLSDVPMLEYLGHPHVVVHDPAMLALANARGWPLLPATPLT
ncbi:HAD-IB family hydrolase [Pseudomonas idahonensis]|uniref:HAD family hydrolase n=1 Tax=Pseudomonas TaxID=286 RepID=UPI00277A0F37|nr:HAD-IB family hydrolase [Pseudomonas protegens]MDP9525302.1 HAD-IB family hydrolase [Pseudomonas protegens]